MGSDADVIKAKAERVVNILMGGVMVSYIGLVGVFVIFMLRYDRATDCDCAPQDTDANVDTCSP